MSTAVPPRPAFLDGPLRLYIGGQHVSTDDRMATIDPATGETLAEVPVASPAQVDLAVQAAADAFRGWRTTPPTQRARLLWALADLIEEHSEELAAIEVLDNGKPIGEARAVDIALTIEIFRYYAGWSTKIAGSVPPNSIPGMLSMIRREPVGVVAAITPWNFPLLEVAYKLGPALAACTVVVKPSELAPLSTLRLMDLAEEAGLPPGVVNAIIGGPDVGAALVAHPAVAKVAFTGQTATGIDPATEMGPLISANHRRRVLGHVASARDDGAQVAVGGGEASPDGLEHGLAEELEAGTVWINTYGMFDVAVPFGGRKHSGFGRELGEEALEPYLTSKSVWVDLRSAAAQAAQAISR